MNAPFGGGDSLVSSRANPEHTLLLDERTLDRSLHYRWVREDLVSKRMVQRYRLVSRKEDQVRTILDEVQPATDDRIRNGDAVLMCCALDIVAERREGRHELNELRLNGPRRKFRNKAVENVVGGRRVRVIEEPDDMEE